MVRWVRWLETQTDGWKALDGELVISLSLEFVQGNESWAQCSRRRVAYQIQFQCTSTSPLSLSLLSHHLSLPDQTEGLLTRAIRWQSVSVVMLSLTLLNPSTDSLTWFLTSIDGHDHSLGSSNPSTSSSSPIVMHSSHSISPCLSVFGFGFRGGFKRAASFHITYLSCPHSALSSSWSYYPCSLWFNLQPHFLIHSPGLFSQSSLSPSHEARSQFSPDLNAALRNSPWWVSQILIFT